MIFTNVIDYTFTRIFFLGLDNKNRQLKIKILIINKLNVDIIKNHQIQQLINHKKENDTLHVFNRFSNQYY